MSNLTIDNINITIKHKFDLWIKNKYQPDLPCITLYFKDYRFYKIKYHKTFQGYKLSDSYKLSLAPLLKDKIFEIEKKFKEGKHV
jgi:hypothetical protein